MSDENEVRLPYYNNVVEFVDDYFRHVFQRQVNDTNEVAWCPEWWRHSEALARFEALWRAWEHYRGNASTGMANWFVDHVDKHMVILFDPAGPFRYCSARGGHRNMLSSLPVEAPPEGLFVVDDIEPYGSVAEFVEQYICTVYRRQVMDSPDMVWCPQWWRHAEAGARFIGLWESWYFKRRQGTVGLSEWFILHADPQMRLLFSPKGPFRFCSVRNGHSDYLTGNPLPMLQPPAEFMSNPAGFEAAAAREFAR